MPRRRERRDISKDVRAERSETSSERPIVVLFADIVGSSEISNHKTLKDYNKFLGEFHEIFRTVMKEHRQTWFEEHERQYFDYDVRGDEGCLKIFVPRRKNLADDVDTAINIALDLKRRWLLSDDNKKRIQESGLLPTDVAIGIHIGKAYINKERDESRNVKYRPEGYVINLTKRIEGESREGRFTSIYVSEAARGALYLLTDESTYTFTSPYSFKPKGISQDTSVFEVKHHFLPTDWNDLREDCPRTKAALFNPTDEDVEIVRLAYHANPTNLWLAEEYIMLKIQREFNRLRDKGKENDNKELETSYGEAKRVSQRLSTGDQCDAGILTIAGFIAGEYGDYEEEQGFYCEALQLDPQYPEAHWYLGYSMSMELYEKLKKKDQTDCKYGDLHEDDQKRVQKIIDSYKKAIKLNPWHSWMHFDLACELARWQKDKKDKEEAIKMLKYAVSLNSSVRYHITDEPYLKTVIDDERVKRLIDDINSTS